GYRSRAASRPGLTPRVTTRSTRDETATRRISSRLADAAGETPGWPSPRRGPPGLDRIQVHAADQLPGQRRAAPRARTGGQAPRPERPQRSSQEEGLPADQ